MWKRANKPSAPASRMIGTPTLLESTYDEADAAKLQDLSELRGGGVGGVSGGGGGNSSTTNSNKHGRNNGLVGEGDNANAPAASQSSQTIDKAKRLPDVPIPPARIERRPSGQLAATTTPVLTALGARSRILPDDRTASLSSAKQPPPPPPPPPPQFAPSTAMAESLRPSRLEIPRSSTGYSHEVSPPDSPRTGDAERSSSPNISPITDGGRSRGSRGDSSSSGRPPLPTSIPVPAGGGSAAYVAGWRDKVPSGGPALQVPPRKESKPTKWDKYSGEPTNSQRGREGSAPVGVPQLSQYDRPPLGHSATVTAQTAAPKPNLFSQTLRKVGKRDSAVSPPPPQREEWKGASGRQALVDPVADKRQPRTKALPTPAQRRKQQGAKPGPAAKHAAAKGAGPASAAASPTARPAIDTPSISPPLETASDDNANSRTTKRRIADQFQRAKRFSLGAADKPDDVPERTSSLPPSQVSSPITPLRQAQSNQPSAAGTPQQVESPWGEFDPSSYLDPRVSNAMEHLGFPTEPGSRFSATTYSTTIPDSRPETPDKDTPPPLPAHQPSILHRKRPIPATVQYPGVKSTIKAPSRKPTPSQMQAGNNGGDADSIFAAPSPAPSGPPPEPEEVDRVTQLEYQMSSLTRRKQNLLTVINELTNVAQPTSVTYDRTSRNEIKKTVSGMSAELAAVTKEIHDTGLKLHRALKKRDQEQNGEASGLWVRRMTE